MPVFHVISFYRFTPLSDLAALQASFKQRMALYTLKGTILLAPEGINATVAGLPENVEAFLNRLEFEAAFSGIAVKRSECAAIPFKRAKVRLKKEIISFGMSIEPCQPQAKKLSPEKWNALLAQENVLLIDTRNAYEIEQGSFVGATNPATRHFREMIAYTEKTLLDAPDRKIAIYCTGGIRCEKYSAYLAARGFSNLYQLEGGILNYLEKIPEQNSLWQGECYVFDQRVTLDHALEPKHG